MPFDILAMNACARRNRVYSYDTHIVCLCSELTEIISKLCTPDTPLQKCSFTTRAMMTAI